MDKQINSTFNTMYDNVGYFDRYSLHIIFVVFVIVLIIGIIIYYHILNNLSSIKNNWEVERCNPKYMPFAGLIHDKKGDEFFSFTSNNFNDCLNNILKENTNKFFSPFFYLINVTSSVFTVVLNSLSAIRIMINNIRENISEVVLDVFKRLEFIIIPILEIFVYMNSVIQKFIASMATVIYTLITTYYTLTTLLISIIRLVVKITWVLAAIIVGLLAIAWLFPPAAIAAGSMSALIAFIVVMVVIIKEALSNAFKIHVSGLNFPF